jgi:hypothetical protein
MSTRQNKAKTLTEKIWGSDFLSSLPAKWRMSLKVIRTKTPGVPNNTDPDGGGDVLDSQVVTNRTNELEKTTTELDPDIGTLVDKDTNQAKQIVTRTETFVSAGATPDTPTATKDVKFENVGAGKVIQTVEEVGSVFDAKTYEKQRPDNIPERFKASTPAITEKHTVTGTATVPSLSTGDIEKSERQVNSFVKETSVTNRDIGSLSTLNGQEIQPRLGLTLPFTEEVEIEGFSGGAVTEVEPLGATLVKLKTYTTSGLLTYSKIFVGMTRLEVPPVLTDLDPFFDYREGGGDFTGTTGDCHWAGAGSWSYSLRGEGQGSAAVVAHVKHSVQQKWGGYTQTQRVVFFLTPPVSAANITTKLTTLLGATVSFMPSFDPTSVSVLLVSNAVSLRAEAQEHVQDGGSGDDNEEHSEYGGSGSSREHSLTIESLNIPPTLHSSFSGTVSDGFSLGASASADAGSESSSPGSEAVTAFVEITGPASTPTTLPTGLHIVALDPEIFYDKIMYHAEVVNM